MVEYGRSHASAQEALRAWFEEVEEAGWKHPNDVKRLYPSASIIDGERVVFNVKGNQYRVVVAIKYRYHAVYIRFIGTHAEYDKIDAATI